MSNIAAYLITLNKDQNLQAINKLNISSFGLSQEAEVAGYSPTTLGIMQPDYLSPTNFCTLFGFPCSKTIYTVLDSYNNHNYILLTYESGKYLIGKVSLPNVYQSEYFDIINKWREEKELKLSLDSIPTKDIKQIEFYTSYLYTH